MKPILKIVVRVLVFMILTVLTQIGGLIYLLNGLFFRKRKNIAEYFKVGSFLILYLLVTLFLIPVIAPLLGREKVKNSEHLNAHSIIYSLCNRTYVKPELNRVLASVSEKLENKLPGIKLVYLDANFPFIDGFPLLPHLSHDDGEKIDVTFIYEKENLISNAKASRSGYGVFESPNATEFDQCASCKTAGYWQYDFTKYISLGSEDVIFSEKGTKTLADLILQESSVGKMFIEPHLKTRLKLKSNKVRFQGCRAVRHDDHIHFQLIP